MEKPQHAELPPALALRLQALDKQFRAGLRQRLDEANGPDASQVYAALHRLVGAAGAYGHTALAAHARQAMDALTVRHAQAQTQKQAEYGTEHAAEHHAAMQRLTAEVERLLG